MIPVNPITIMFNQMKVGAARNKLQKNHLPEYGIIITSGYRNREKNTEVGGAQDSTHMYGLGEDWVLTYENVVLNESQMEKIFYEKIEPNWPGYALFEGDHIHVNLNREESKKSSILAWSAIGIGSVGFLYFTSGGKKIGTR